ncbi:MAG: hypothetical protein ACTSVV_14540, partial [Promethearchaeota archaeon]
MLLNALVNIGRVIEGETELEDFAKKYDPEIVKFINMRYSSPPKMDRIVKINIAPGILDAFDTVKLGIERIDPEFWKNIIDKFKKKLDKKKRDENKKEVINEIIKKLNLDINDFQRYISLEVIEYNKEHPYLMLRGEKKGNNVFLSPTMFTKISSKKIESFPLWKINLDISLILPEKEDEEIIFIKNFFQNLPSLSETSKIKEIDADLIFKFIISEIFLRVLNSDIERENLKTGYYFFPICFNGKWPHNIEIFKEYYKKKTLSDENAPIGICSGCGERKNVEKGLTKELGFFSIDQNSFTYSFFKDSNYQLCNECKYLVEVGFNHVKKDLRIFLGARGRGKRKNPYELYVIPIADDLQTLSKILKELKFTKDYKEKIIKAGELAQESNNQEEEEGEEVSEQILPAKEDLHNFFINYYFSRGEKKEKDRFELLLITYYHPDGQSSDFHNIISIDLLDHEKIIKLSDVLSELELNGEFISLKDIFFLFGIHKFKTYISKYLNLKRIDLSTLCRDAYLNLKQEFFKFMSNPSNPPNFIRLNLYRLNIYFKLINKLNLI